MPAVTIGSETILHDAIAEVRRFFPGATVNEVLRMAALTSVYGERKAREIVFTRTMDIKLSNGRLPLTLTAQERELLKTATKKGVNFSEMVRLGLAKLTHQDDIFVAPLKRGGPRKYPERMPDEAARP